MEKLENNNSGLPKGWIETTIGEVCEFEYGKALKQDKRIEDGHFNVYGSNGVVGNHDKYIIEGPCLIIGRKGAAGAIHYSSRNCWPIDTTYFIRDIKNLNLKFLYYQLLNLNLPSLEKSTAIPGLNRNDAYEKPFCLAPLPEQNRIVEKLDELLSELEKGKEQLQVALAQLKVYRQAVLNSFIQEGSLKSIESITEKLDQGWSPKCLNEKSNNINQWAVIKTSAIQHGNFVEDENKVLPSSLNPKIQHEIKPGDILITRAGPRVRTGVCCLVRNIRPRLLNSDKVYRLRLSKDVVLPEYFELVLNSPKYLQIIEEMKTGISDSGVNLTQTAFLKIEIPVPSTIIQKQIVFELKNKLASCDQIEATITQALQQAEALKQSLLQQAFEGKLVPQNPDDEPASVLLERIKRERENATMLTKSPRSPRSKTTLA